MTEVIAADPLLRADLRICRNLGIRFGDWLDLDDFERTVWRAFEAHEADLCPGCGQPRTEALFDASREAQPAYAAGFTQCLACQELLTQQEAQRVRDAKKLHALTANAKHPDLVPRPVTGHRHWMVQPHTPNDGEKEG